MPSDKINTALTQIVNIEYVTIPNRIKDNLPINQQICPRYNKKIEEFYLNHLLKIKELSKFETNFEMSIVLKHEQPISFRPRRFSFSDKKKLQVTLECLLERKIIRSNDSRCAILIALVRKKSDETRLYVDIVK